MMEKINSRRDFLKTSTLTAAGIALGNSLLQAAPAGKVLGSNDTVNTAIIGCNGRAKALTEAIAGVKGMKVTHICDVDQNILADHAKYCQSKLGYVPEKEADFRNILDNKDVDAIVVATPEHWHAIMSIMGMQAGKHVYVEKPCSHNPYENELLVQVQKKYGMVCQMGNQQRSASTSIKAVKEIHDGIIGRAYMGKAWYSNKRGPIGIGKEGAVPSTLNWDLWQGPAPREVYRDNVHPYNWHWFRTWGTGEIHNNGTHEIDICRWALEVDYPNRVVSTGGRLHGEKDDWQYFDTQLASYEFDGGKTISWEGRSCNNMNMYDQGRGSMIFGTKGSMMLTRSGTVLYDLAGKEIRKERESDQGSSVNTADTSGFDNLTTNHMRNFLNAIRENEPLQSPIADGSISTLLCHLGNIAQTLGESLLIDSSTGRILKNRAAMKMWKREYEKGWEPKL